MKKILLLLLFIGPKLFAQQQQLVDVLDLTTVPSKSYIYTTRVTIPAPSSGSLTISAAAIGSFYIRPVQGGTIPSNAPPSTDQSFVRNESVLITGVTSEDQLAGLQTGQIQESYKYFDEAGRSSQDVVVMGSPARYDMVKPYAYETNGRQRFDYLGYTSAENTGAFKVSAINAQSTFYSTSANGITGDSRPFVDVIYEQSVLGRPKEVFGYGELWNNGTTIQKSIKSYSVLCAANIARLWYIDLTTGALKTTVCYPEASLTVDEHRDEDNNIIRTYTDEKGKVILVENNALQTYYVYDAFGQLRFVLPPEFNNDYPVGVTTIQPSQTLLNTWAYQFKYDSKRRLIQEKAPGDHNDWVYYVYDQWSRLVAKQDGAQRLKSPKEWSFIKYDELNRPVMTGVLKTTYTEHDEMIGAVSGGRFEVRDANVALGYSTASTFPKVTTSISTVDVLAATYYDDYGFKTAIGWAESATAYDASAGLPFMASVKGMVTGTKIKILDQSNWLNTVNYYDVNYRVIQRVEKHHLTTTPDRITNAYNFAGWPTKSSRTHTGPSGTTTIVQDFEYDHTGRPTKLFHQINDGPRILLASRKYNEVGQLIEKNLHSTDGGTSFLQSLDYRYNIRGWLTSINNSSLTNDGVMNNDSDDLFGMGLVYNQETLQINGTASNPRWNGTITGAKWKTNDLKTTPKERAFAYDYDAKNRITKGRYAAKTGGNWTDEAGYYNLQIDQYDDNGNIVKLKRYGRSGTTATLIDDLTYGYTANSNELATVEDAAPQSSFGYPNATAGISPELQYDMNGNATSDLNSQMTSVTYNYLNLPSKIVIDRTGTLNDYEIAYVYDASGYALQKTLKRDGVPIKTIDYVRGIQYYDQQLALVFTPEGRATPYNGKFEYEYFVKDHLSNTRSIFGSVHDIDVYKATMETESASKENADFPNLPSVPRFVGNNITTPTLDVPLPDESAILHGYTGGTPVGPAKMLSVKAGDKVKMEAFARYSTNVSSNSVISTLVTAVTGAFGIINSGETQAAYQTMNSTLPGLSRQVIRNTNAPKAYLFYLLLDKNYAYTGQFGYASVPSTATLVHQRLELDIVLPTDGFMYIYVANESNVSGAAAYFDDFKIVHHKTTSSLRITEVEDYDPFGFLLEGTRYVDVGRLANSYQYQGDFAEFDALVGWNRFEGRGNYDARLGRWHSTDPANQYQGFSPYHGMGNNPVARIDPDGRFLPAVVLGAALLGGVGNVWSHWDDIAASGSIMQGAAFFAGGFVAGAVSTVNPLAGASILSAGNVAIDLAAGRAPDLMTAATDFGFTWVGGKMALKSAQAAKAVYGELDAFLADAAARNSFSTIGTVIRTSAEDLAEAARLGVKLPQEMPQLEFAVKETEIVIERSVGAAVRGFSRNLWTLTDEGAEAIATHKTWGKFYKSVARDGTVTWWSADKYGHGGSAFKVFRETPKGLEWIHDADKFGDYIVGKHKGPTGSFIPWDKLNIIR